MLPATQRARENEGRPHPTWEAAPVARRSWLVEAGESGRLARLFESSGTVALGWADVPGLEDLTGLDRDAVIDLLRGHRTVDAAHADATLLVRFRDDLRPGDLVVSVDTPARQLLVGEVTGAYEYRTDAPSDAHHHVRTVEWYGRYGRDDRTALSEEMARRTGLDAAVVELTPTDAWLALAARVRERPPLAAAAPRPAPARATRAAATKRAPRVAKPVVVPPPTHRLCPGCFSQKLLSQFRAGSEFCVVCREDRGDD